MLYTVIVAVSSLVSVYLSLIATFSIPPKVSFGLGIFVFIAPASSEYAIVGLPFYKKLHGYPLQRYLTCV